MLGTGDPKPWIAEKRKRGPICVLHNAHGVLGWKWTKLPFLGMPRSGSFKGVELDIYLLE